MNFLEDKPSSYKKVEAAMKTKHHNKGKLAVGNKSNSKYAPLSRCSNFIVNS